MSERDDYPHGVPCWVTCLAADVGGAMAFYGELFGWEYETSPDGGYAQALLRGRLVAGIGSLAAAGEGVPPAWMTEVRVDSADGLDGVIAGPIDLSPAGRLAVLRDPAGGTICAWEAEGRRGAQLVNEPGAWSMSALATPDREAAAAFYGSVFGWETEPFGPATMFRLPGYVGGEPEQPVSRDVVAAMVGGDEAVWNVDFWVAGCEAAVATAERAGGTVVTAPFEDGPFIQARLADPEGAVFSVSELRA